MKKSLKYRKFEINGWENTIEGIVLHESEKWILTRHIFSDYMLDGYAVINKKHIKKTYSDRFKEKIILLKMGNDYNIPFDFKLKSSKQIINSFANKNLLFEIEDEDDSCCFIGKSKDTTSKSFTIKNLSPKIKWGGEMTFKYKDVRMFQFLSDYLLTLESNSK